MQTLQKWKHSHLDEGRRIKLGKENCKILKTDAVLNREDQRDLTLNPNSHLPVLCELW